MTNSIFEKIKELEQELSLIKKKNQLLEEKLSEYSIKNVTKFITKDQIYKDQTDHADYKNLENIKELEDKLNLIIIPDKSQNLINKETISLNQNTSDINQKIKNIFLGIK
jgi:hypothetical protein